MNNYPAWFRPGLLVALALLLLSGLLLAPTTLLLRADLDIGWRLDGGGRVWAAAAHALAGMGLCFALGALWAVHMRSGWRRRRQRRSGGLLAASFCVLSLSAVGVYYLGDEAWANAAAVGHLGIGLAASAAFGWHWWRGKHRRRRH